MDLLTAPQLTFPVWKNWILPLVRSHIAVVLILRHVWAYIMRKVLPFVSALVIYHCVCFVRDVRKPAHYLIIQSHGAAQLCL